MKEKINSICSQTKQFFLEKETFSLFLLFIFSYIIFDIRIIKEPFIWSEDTIFLNEALTDGIRSLFYRHNAYLELISRVSGILAITAGRIFNDYQIVTFIMKTIAIFLACYYISYFWISDFEWVMKDRRCRFAVSLLMLVWICNYLNMMYNVTSIHWFGEIYIFLIGLNTLHGNYPKKFDLVLMVLTMLNSPEACIIAAPCVILLLISLKNKAMTARHIGYACLTSACALIQFFCLATGEKAVGTAVSDLTIGWHLFFSVTEWFGFMAELPAYLFGCQFVSAIPHILRIIIGVLVWIRLWKCYKECRIPKNAFFYIVSFIGFHYLLVAYKYPVRISQSPVTWELSPSICMLIILLAFIKEKESIKTGLITIISVLVIVSQISGIGKIHNPNDSYHVNGAGDYISYDYTALGMDRLRNVFDRVDFSSDEYEYVNLYRFWNAQVPVQKTE